MTTVKINQKTYTVPDLTFKHLPMMEKCGLSIFEMLSGKYIFTTVQVFTCIVVGCDTDHADHLLEQHILGGGDIMQIYEAFSQAVHDSSFFAKMLDRKTPTSPAEMDSAPIPS